MELKAYHLRTWRVSGLNKDMTHRIEDITVKLVGESSLEKYCKFLPVNGYVQDKPPKIVKVLERTSKTVDKRIVLEWRELGENAISEAQERVTKLLNAPITGQKVDYKSELEDQKKRNEVQKKRNEDLESRLKALENKPKPGPKAKQSSEGNTTKLKTNEQL